MVTFINDLYEILTKRANTDLPEIKGAFGQEKDIDMENERSLDLMDQQNKLAYAVCDLISTIQEIKTDLARCRMEIALLNEKMNNWR